MKLVKLLTIALVSATPLAADVASAGAIDEAVRSSHIFSTVFQDGVQVTSSSGVVTLTGTVLDEKHRLLAEETAGAVQGVTRVVNQLQVAAPAQNSDDWIRLQLLDRFLLARGLGDSAIRVTVKDGIVTLTGESQNLVERNLAEIYAKEVQGVREVRNEVTVRAKDAEYQIDDASLRGLVGFTFRSNQSTKHLNLNVDVRDGNVTVTGEVPTPLHKDFVRLLAETVRSVGKVTADLKSS